ncbi:MAG: PA2779 family protein [Cycloclasticus sp.]|nr:PA2779 family protein [Cycloclasticus sp.]
MKALKRTFSLILAIALIGISIGNAQASIITNDQIIHKTVQANDRVALMQTINRVDVQAQLSSMGVSSADIEARIDQMTNEEIAQLNQHIAELPAGAGILGAALTVFIVLVITDMLGATDVFSFVHSINR